MQTGSSIRVHRRSVYLDGASWTILSPRPEDPARFATGLTGDSVHVLGSAASLEFLAHVLWALAFQQHARTVVLFDLPSMVPNPVTSESSRPVLWCNAELGAPTPPMLDGLRGLLPISSPSEGTLKLRTAGLDRALADPVEFAANERADTDSPKWNADEWDTWVTRQAGLVTVVMPPAALRAYAAAAAEFGAFSWESLDPSEPGVSDEEVVVLNRMLLDRAATLRTGRTSAHPGRGFADLSAPERAELWKRYANA